MKRIAPILVHTVLVSVVITSDLFSQVMHPRVSGRFWQLPRDVSGIPIPGGDAFGDSVGMEGGDSGLPIADWGWDHPYINFSRQFDVLDVARSHIITWTHTYDEQDALPHLKGHGYDHKNSLNTGDSYNHDDGHGGSAQQLLGKAKAWGVWENNPMQVFANFDPQKINVNDFTLDNIESPGRELTDCLSPACCRSGPRFLEAVQDSEVCTKSRECSQCSKTIHHSVWMHTGSSAREESRSYGSFSCREPCCPLRGSAPMCAHGSTGY